DRRPRNCARICGGLWAMPALQPSNASTRSLRSQHSIKTNPPGRRRLNRWSSSSSRRIPFTLAFWPTRCDPRAPPYSAHCPPPPPPPTSPPPRGGAPPPPPLSPAVPPVFWANPLLSPPPPLFPPLPQNPPPPAPPAVAILESTLAKVLPTDAKALDKEILAQS